MTMRLLTPEEIKASKASELARDLRRTQDIKETLDKTRTTLNNVKAEFDVTLANQRLVWIKEQEQALQTINDLNHEIEVLKREREQLLIPIDLDRKRADNIITEASNLMAQATDKQKYADELVEKIQDRLDEIGEKEESLQKREEHLFVREKGLEDQTEVTRKNSEQVTLQMQTFITEMEDKEKDFNTKKRRLDLLEINLVAREKINNEREEYLNGRERQINDKYETLLRTENRLKQ